MRGQVEVAVTAGELLLEASLLGARPGQEGDRLCGKLLPEQLLAVTRLD